ncbi:hypothetical protein FKP32DRAFT_1583597 [Trametes sanguinea]|nr:hypothetical protein FKP32DRAFT_1583597 [Trametes sanguinea]
MHNLMLGNLRHHCRHVWGINVKDNETPKSSKSSPKPHTPLEQQTWLNKVITHVQQGLPGKLSKVRKGYIVAVAELNGVVPVSPANASKEQWLEALMKWWAETPGQVIKVPPVLPEATDDFHLVKGQYDLSKFRILDQSTISQIRRDITETVLPSWLERPPRNFGSRSHGKLKADHWRTVCTVSMVVTLVRLWGSSSATAKEKALLENFVHLVSAVDLATRRSMSPERAEKFDEHISQYLAGLQELFDWHHFVPNHHISLHILECLLNFGPVHAWWAFPFERFNGLLQNLNTSSKAEAMPLTFMRYFYMGANLRWLMATTEWPNAPPFQSMAASFNTAFRNAARGTRLADFRFDGSGQVFRAADLDYNERAAVTLSRDIYDLLVDRIRRVPGNSHFASFYDSLSNSRPRLTTEVQYTDGIDCEGVRFARKGAHGRNSFLLFSCTSDIGLEFPRAGRIREIFLHVRAVDGQRTVEPFFVVDEYEPILQEHVPLDPYRRFPDLQTRLFYDQFKKHPCILTLSDIHAHFAAFFYKPSDIQKNCIVVRSLDRVCTICTITVAEATLCSDMIL